MLTGGRSQTPRVMRLRLVSDLAESWWRGGDAAWAGGWGQKGSGTGLQRQGDKSVGAGTPPLGAASLWATPISLGGGWHPSWKQAQLRPVGNRWGANPNALPLCFAEPEPELA